MVKAKKAPKRKTKYYDEHQVNLFESGMNEYWGRKHLDLITLFTLLIHTGARFGEVIGLHWSDIDYNEQRITFGGRVSHINGGGRSEYLDGLKNGDDFLIVSGHLIFQLRWSWSMYGNSIRLPSESGTGISEKSLECMSDLRMGLRLHNQFPGKLSLEAL